MRYSAAEKLEIIQLVELNLNISSEINSNARARWQGQNRYFWWYQRAWLRISPGPHGVRAAYIDYLLRLKNRLNH
jgi:hypothetical protein